MSLPSPTKARSPEKQLAGSAAGSIGRKVVSATGGYSYKNAAKYVAMNVMNKARGVTYL